MSIASRNTAAGSFLPAICLAKCIIAPRIALICSTLIAICDRSTEASPDEARAIQSLACATFVPGCAPKRFVREMAGMNPDVYILSDRQRGYLWAIAWSYRKQLPDDLVEIARRESGERGINSHKNPPVLPPAAPRKKRARVSKPAQPEEGVLLAFDQELPQISHPVAAFGLEWLEKRATDLEQPRGKVSGQ